MRQLLAINNYIDNNNKDILKHNIVFTLKKLEKLWKVDACWTLVGPV